ncbi:MAG: hypothetical protein IJM17_07735 [Firmicutes bacterium]|nr:hypothetical protein [Bacillota bacterium]
MKLYHDVPFSKGAENVLKRVRQQMDVEWTPMKPLPCTYNFKGPDYKLFYHAHFTKWRPQKGLPYSSTRMTEKYLGWNISFETFLTAMKNPNSMLYTRQLKDFPGARGTNCWYGTVCSMFVSYALEIPYRVVCHSWARMPEIHPVDTGKLENIRLCDIVLDPTRHIGIVTDILRDADGKVHFIEVSEALMPITESKLYSPEDFRHYWLEDGFSVFRYDKVDSVSYTPNPWVYVEGDPDLPKPKITAALMLDAGNRSNFRVQDEPVEISVFEEGWDFVEVTDPDGNNSLHPFTGGKLVLRPQKPGYYSARLAKGDERSDDIQWCMVDINLRFGKEKYAVGEPVDLHFDNAAEDEKIFHCVLSDEMFLIMDSAFFTEEEGEKGEAFCPPAKKPGTHYVIVLAKNDYGIYCSPFTAFTAE